MAKTKYKIYTLDFLSTTEMADDDMYYICETPSFTYSLLVGMFTMAGYKMSEKKIINVCKEDQWMYKYFWDNNTRQKFEKILEKIYYNLFRYGKYTSRIKTEWWITQYGLTNKDVKNDVKKYILND